MAGHVPDRARPFLAIRHPVIHRLVVRRYSHGMFWYHGAMNGGVHPFSGPIAYPVGPAML